MENHKTPQTVAVGAAENVKRVDFCIKDESEAIGKEEINFKNEIDSSIAGCLSACMVGVEDEVKCVKQKEVEKGCLSEGGGVNCEKESDIGIEKIVEKGCKPINVARDDSIMNIEVSGDGLSLYVDFTNLNDDLLDSEIIASENMPKVAEEQMKIVENGHRTYNFTEGDVVWLKIRNQKWWPGKVETESDDERGSLMVEHFGNRNVTKCLPSQLKPFQENFKVLSENSKSRSFLGAVEQALNEFGRRIKLEMTCSCAEHPNHKKIASFPLNRSSVFAEFSVTNFEPALFLAYLKNIAQRGFVFDALELIVMEHRLSAFYGSVGCFQLPLHELCETSDAGDSQAETSSISAVEKEETKLKSGKRNRINYDQELDYSVDSTCREQNDGSYKKREHGPESRERKRSKYLSYPYINWGQISTTAVSEDSAWKISHGSVQVTVDDDYNLVPNGSGSKFWMKWYKQFSTGIDVFDDSELINVSSANFLSELRFIALNCLHPSTNENFVSVGWFFSRFRVSEFHDESAYIGENVDIAAEPCLRKKLVEGKRPSASKSEGTKRKRRASSKNEGGSNSIPEMEECKSNNIEPSSLLVKDSLENGFRTANRRPKQKMTKQGASSVHEQSEQRTSLPYLNRGRRKVERKTRKKKGIALEHSTVTSELLDANEGSKNGSFFIDLQVMPPAAAAGKHEEKMTLCANVVPDLNGIEVECSNVIQAQSKLERRNESFSGDQISDSAPGKPYMDIDGGLDTVLLTFSPEARTPSMEELITTFGKFGPLRESESKFTDSSNARLVFVKADNAGEAIRSVEMNKPFGAAIVKYQLCNHSAPTWFSDDHSSKTSASMEEYMTPANSSEWKPNTDEEEPEESESEGDDINTG